MADLTLKKWNGSTWEDTYPQTTHTQIVATGTPSSTTYLRGDGVWATAYTHPTYAGDDFSIDTGPLTGATVISDLDINITTNTTGHVTDANATVSTRNLTAADIGAAASSHTHTNDEITFPTSPLTSYTSSVYLAVKDASNELNYSGLNFGGSSSNYLSEAGTWEALPASGGGGTTRYTLGSTVSTTTTGFSNTGLTFPIDAGKYYLVNFYGKTYTDGTTTGLGLAVITSSTTGTPTVSGWFTVQSSSTASGTTSILHNAFSQMQTTSSTLGRGILGLNGVTNSGAPGFVTFSAVMYGGSSVNKTMTIQFRTETNNVAAYLMEGATVTVTELTT